MSKRAEAVWILAGFAALAVAATYPLILAPATTFAGDPGDPLLTAWTLAWDADRIRHGLRGIWDAPSYFPYRHTLLYSDHLLGIALFTAPIQWLAKNAVVAYNAAYIASPLLSGLGMYLLARALTRRRDAALVAGVIYAMQPFRVSHMPHLQWLITGWLPLSLWALHKYFERPRWRMLLAAAGFFLLQATTASYFMYFALLPLLIVAAGEWIRTRAPLTTLARSAAPSALLAVIVLTPIARGYLELRAEQHLKRSTGDITAYSADVADYVSASPDLRVWRGIGPGRGEHELFIGLTAMLLGIVGVLACWRLPAVRVYAVVAVTAFILSLGPQPTAWGHAVGLPGPYAILLRTVPGLDGLRAIARLAVVVQIGIAILAAFGAAWLLDRAGSAAPALTTVLLLAIAAEGWAAPLRVAPFDPNAAGPDRDAYDFLATLPSGAALELPTSVENFDWEFVYQFHTLTHRHPIVNGHSSYVTPLLAWLGGGHSPLRDVDRQADAIAAVRAVGVRYLIVHRSAFADASLLDALTAALNDPAGPVIAQRQFGDTVVAVLTPHEQQPAPEPTQAVETASIHAAASHSADRVPQLFDGDPDSRWISAHPQTGDEWLQCDLDRARDIAVVQLQLGTRSFGDYPRLLEIDVVEKTGERPVFRGTVLPQFARGLLNDGEHPWIEIALPPNRAQTLRLRQTGTARTFFWSVHELRLRERI